MWTPLFLLGGLMIATAVIAYWSDNLGKKLGKKRVTLFGLRPKQTATLITIASSLVIMLVTFGTMLVVYQPLQDALLSFDQVRADRTLFEQQNTRLSGDIDQLKVQENTLRISIRTAQEAEAKAVSGKEQAVKRFGTAQEKEAAAKERESRAKRAEASAKRGETTAKRAEVTAKRGEETANRDAETARHNLETVRSDLDRAQNDLRVAQDKLKPVQTQLKTVQTNLKTAQANLKTVQAKLKTTNAGLLQRQDQVVEQGKQILGQERRVAELETSVSTLKGSEKTLQDSERALQSKADALTKLVTERQQEVDEAMKRLEIAANALIKPSIVTARETLAEQLIEPRKGAETVTRLVRELLQQARENVRRLGELNPPSGEDKRAQELKVGIAPRRVTLDNQEFDAGENAQIDIIAASLAQSPTPAMVRVVAARNHAIDEEEIKADFQVLPVLNAYRSDDIIATSTIDGTLSDAQVFNQLLRLLNEGERAARGVNKRVQPPEGGDNKFYAEGTNERLFEALRAITLLKSSARVRLRAADDLTTTAPLKVRFEVLPAS